MKIERIEMGETTVLRLEGDVDDTAVHELRDALYDCLREGRFNLVINLSRVGYLSYLGLGIVIERLRRVRAVKGDIKLVGINLYMERLFRMVGASRLFEIFENEHQAVHGYQEAA